MTIPGVTIFAVVVFFGVTPVHSSLVVSVVTSVCDSLDPCAQRYNGIPTLGFRRGESKAEFDNYCKLFDDYKQCCVNNSALYKPVIDCMNIHLASVGHSTEQLTIRVMLDDNEELYQAICGQGAKLVIHANMDCWNNNGTQQALFGCVNESRSRVHDTNEGGPYDPAKHVKWMCDLRRSFPDCAKESLEEICNSAAANVVSNVYQVTLNQVGRLVGCDDNSAIV